MRDFGKPKACSECLAPLTHSREGRPKVTCSHACLLARRRRVKRFRKQASVENLSEAEKAYLEDFRREMVAPQPKRGAP